jgi:16S rRNA (cytidine1402-2'-O)-methyltransferase
MDDFHYVGFVPHKKGRQTLFAEMSAREIPSIFLESTHRIEKTLDALAVALSPTRMICLGRELTKMHETLYRGTVAEVQAALHATSHKGEFIGVVGPAKFALSSKP